MICFVQYYRYASFETTPTNIVSFQNQKFWNSGVVLLNHLRRGKETLASITRLLAVQNELARDCCRLHNFDSVFIWFRVVN